MAERRCDLFNDIFAVVDFKLQENGFSKNESTLISSEIIENLSCHWAGQNLTFPKEHARKLKIKELYILSAFNGKNISELSKQYDMSERGMRKLLKRASHRKSLTAQ